MDLSTQKPEKLAEYYELWAHRALDIEQKDYRLPKPLHEHHWIVGEVIKMMSKGGAKGFCPIMHDALRQMDRNVSFLSVDLMGVEPTEEGVVYPAFDKTVSFFHQAKRIAMGSSGYSVDSNVLFVGGELLKLLLERTKVDIGLIYDQLMDTFIVDGTLLEQLKMAKKWLKSCMYSSNLLMVVIIFGQMPEDALEIEECVEEYLGIIDQLREMLQSPKIKIVTPVFPYPMSAKPSKIWSLLKERLDGGRGRSPRKGSVTIIDPAAALSVNYGELSGYREDRWFCGGRRDSGLTGPNSCVNLNRLGQYRLLQLLILHGVPVDIEFKLDFLPLNTKNFEEAVKEMIPLCREQDEGFVESVESGSHGANRAMCSIDPQTWVCHDTITEWLRQSAETPAVTWDVDNRQAGPRTTPIPEYPYTRTMGPQRGLPMDHIVNALRGHAHATQPVGQQEGRIALPLDRVRCVNGRQRVVDRENGVIVGDDGPAEGPDDERVERRSDMRVAIRAYEHANQMNQGAVEPEPEEAEEPINQNSSDAGACGLAHHHRYLMPYVGGGLLEPADETVGRAALDAEPPIMDPTDGEDEREPYVDDPVDEEEAESEMSDGEMDRLMDKWEDENRSGHRPGKG